MRAYYINADTDEHGVVDTEATLADMYELIGCRCIDIVMREVNGNPLNIVIDDEGLLKPNRVTAVSVARDVFGTQERLAGSILIFGVGEDGDLCQLTEREVDVIESRVIGAAFSDGSTHPTFWYSR